MGGPCGVSLQQKITPSEVTSCHGEGNLDGDQVQLGVTGTCKAEAGQRLRTSLVWQQAAVGRLCSERRRLGPRPCLRCMLVCSLGQRWGACPPTCSQSCPALEGTPAPISAPHQRLEVTARVSEASCKSAKKARPAAAACGGPAPPDAWQLFYRLLLGTPAQAIGGR
ncbi:hypothetical protein J1605_012976 [Eschrichtius robustus]|uniref:Uncharacterized protein n=1 Tax=Eschrichtius robustus TaxID=9764 RepID=A0AB34GK83_ESCRO|nr:hypothetical protein J1605_012976 [Eschrichtius robustus]